MAVADIIPLAPPGGRSDPIVCLSHLRWTFVLQRPQHLMSRFARQRTVIFFEEPLPAEAGAAMGVDIRTCEDSGVIVATPRVPDGLEGPARNAVLRQLLDEVLAAHRIERPVVWYYTPMMAPVARHLDAAAVVYDCMDELANFAFAPPDLVTLERELFAMADVVFTGGYSLYEAKRELHSNIHPIPSSVDRDHFAQARSIKREMEARWTATLGFFGVIDERMDLDLIARVAEARPDWLFEIVGPVVKIDPARLPSGANIRYPGQAAYDDLPAWLARWDVALMPFAQNESTRFISPTKTPEYLAAGRPVVSTPIRDVVRHYGDLMGVKIASEAETFAMACDEALALMRGEDETWLEEIDAALSSLSWDQTQLRMAAHVDGAARRRRSGIGAGGPPAAWSSRRRRHFDALVVGAGFAGSVLSERLAAAGQSVLLIDRRDHIGGNAYDRKDAAGLLIHQYGPHIFHTNSADVFDYLSRFTAWRPYEHRVLAQVRGQLTPMPINRTTLNLLYGLNLASDEAAEAFLASKAEPVETIRTSEDVVVNAVGRELYELFFRGYTRKQWGLDPSELDRSVTARVPTRVNTDDRYFTDAFQAMPLHGYTRMFENMLDHAGISIETGVDFRDVAEDVTYDRLIFTGPIDEFFDHRFGPLPYRSLSFRHETIDSPRFQPVATVNYPDEAVPYTRVTEYKHLTGQEHAKTSITYEYPSAEGDPYYPIPRAENQALFKRYEELARQRPDVTFAGRLATYRYYNMDQVTGQALALARRLLVPEKAASPPGP